LIGRNAFRETGLRAIHIPASVTVLQFGCFMNCTALSSITFEAHSRLVAIESNAFRGTGIKKICIPTSRVTLDPECFADCRSMLSLTFGAYLRR
jgi:hypothetical protein